MTSGGHARAASEEVLTVTVDDVVFQSDDGRFSVVRGMRDQGEEVTVVGDLGTVTPGETLRVRGRFARHASYGMRFKATGFTPIMPTSEAGLARYLGSGLIPGIGPALAQRLVAEFGTRTLDVATDSSRLTRVPGIGKKRAGAIAEAIRERRAEAETMSYLHDVGFGPATARRVMKKYGHDAVRVVREDPYLLAEEVRGIGFRTADRIGRAAGIAEDDPRRAAGAVLHLLGKGADDGHVFVFRQQLTEGASELSVPADRADAAIDLLAGRGVVILEPAPEGDAVYAPPLHRAETAVGALLGRLAAAERRAPRELERAMRSAADSELSDTQMAGVRATLLHGVVVLTGGPGTGKTTTVRAIVAAHESIGRRIHLLAPTGRAAKRLSEATGRNAKTIHRALEWSPRTASFGRDADNPLDAEVVLVDEASMLDVRLSANLLAAIPPSSTLVLVGDVDQLPPVSAGQVLRELLASGVAEVVRLSHVFRQAQRSSIVRGAHAILHGSFPTPTPTGTKGDGDLFIVRARNPDALADRLLSVLDRMCAAYGLDRKHDIQVLSPMRRASAGTERLNELLRAALNPGTKPEGPGFVAGDKVMQLKNDYDKEVFNGDLGEVKRVVGGSTFVTIDGREVQYSVEDLDALALAYACTVHKVQGSEFPAVVIVLHGSHHVLLSRALLYTAVTRAKRLVVLLGDERAMRRAVSNARTYESNSRLVERLRRVVALAGAE